MHGADLDLLKWIFMELQDILTYFVTVNHKVRKLLFMSWCSIGRKRNYCGEEDKKWSLKRQN